MKKLLIFSLLAIAFNAMADDYYLYWMLPDSATLTSVYGESTSALANLAAEKGWNNLYAKIRMEDTSGQQSDTYLTLYSNPSPDAGYGDKAEVDLAMPASALTFVAVSTDKSPIQGGNINYYVELYNDWGGEQADTWIGRQLLQWDESMVTTAKDMANPANWVVVSQFSAAPEPTSGFLLLVGLAGLALRRRNKRA